MKQLLAHRFPSDTAELEQVRRQVRSTLERLGCEPEFTETCVLAVDEAVANVMRHGYAGRTDGEVTLSIHEDGDELVFSLRDFAPSFVPGEGDRPVAGELRSGGYGRILIDEIMDSVRYDPCVRGAGNLLRMRRRLERSTPQR